MNSFNLILSGKHFICPSIINDSFAGQSNLGCRSLPFMTLNTSFQPLACKVSFEKSADFSLMGTPFWVTLSFPLAAFKILSLSLILGNFIMMSWCVSAQVQLLWDSVSFLDFLEVHFPCQIGEVVRHYFFTEVFDFLLFLFSFWHPYDSDVGTFKVVSEVPKPLLIFLNSSFFILFG